MPKEFAQLCVLDFVLAYLNELLAVFENAFIFLKLLLPPQLHLRVAHRLLTNSH